MVPYQARRRDHRSGRRASGARAPARRVRAARHPRRFAHAAHGWRRVLPAAAAGEARARRARAVPLGRHHASGGPRAGGDPARPRAREAGRAGRAGTADQRVRAGEGGLMLIVVVLFATVLLRAAIVMTFVYLMLPKAF